jgi:hypothetical protein
MAMSDDEQKKEFGDTYDFSNWETGESPDIEEPLDMWVRSNIRTAFELFAQGRWTVAWHDDDEDHGEALEWRAEHYELDQPAWITFTPAILARALLDEVRSRLPDIAKLTEVHQNHREDILPILEGVIPLWRKALDIVEAEVQRILALPVKK